MSTGIARAQTLEEELKRALPAQIAQEAREGGDASRGAVVFHQAHIACSRCHAVGTGQTNLLGPDLSAIAKDSSDQSLVESILDPSKVIQKGFQSVTAVTEDGVVITGLLVERTNQKTIIRDASRNGELVSFNSDELADYKLNAISLMPTGQVNQLSSRQQFLDLVRYLIEIRDGGPARAKELQPAAALIALSIPEYEQHLDHKGLIGSWNEDSFKRGEAIYQRVCANCHGTKDKAGSLPTSLRFATGKFKNGSDPHAMYRTLTYGFGQMVPQAWMVPSQKYDVIHYIREAYLKKDNPSQYVDLVPDLLARLPKGDTFGPEPSNIESWSAMDYGPSLTHTYEIPGKQSNIAFKGIAIRLDPGIGGVSRGRHWMLWDSDTFRVAAAWNGDGDKAGNFIDWQGIQFNGAHGVHPRIVGKTAYANSTGPGWGAPAIAAINSFADNRRVMGRDGKPYGPLPRSWAKFLGQYHFGQQVVLKYTVDGCEVLESPSLQVHNTQQTASQSAISTNDKAIPADGNMWILRTFNVSPHPRPLTLQVAEHASKDASISAIDHPKLSMVSFGVDSKTASSNDKTTYHFDGNTYLEMEDATPFDMNETDFEIGAKIKTQSGGTIWSLSEPGPKWSPNGQSFFVRGGRLVFDIGWVGAVSGKTKIDDGKWHDVSVSWKKNTKRLELYVDGKRDGEGNLASKMAIEKSVARIGFTAANFPQPKTFFEGSIAEVRFARPASDKTQSSTMVAKWEIGNEFRSTVVDNVHNIRAVVQHGNGPIDTERVILAAFAPASAPVEFLADHGNLRLRLAPNDKPLRFSIWQPVDNANFQSTLSSSKSIVDSAQFRVEASDRDLSEFTQGGPARWPERIETQMITTSEGGPLAVDVLSAPESNPWLAQTRFTGLDFYRDGRIAVCTWDGDVWIVTPNDESKKLSWQRVASGLFQPLGLKIIDGKIHLTCRDQLTVLHDLNGDGETDFYQCLNNDHQVTTHFHEFAMGLQIDQNGNFYYAKSGCHGIKATVPHHGTLLRVSKDGEKTEILATGFRAANGVCLNPDGTFFVTDQEGFWNPKNRINWVSVPNDGKPNFYGNMWGYHDVVDESDSAMVPPLCWITNAFDRSPAELLWVDSKSWGPLNGSLLNLSYGYGKVFLVPHERVGELMQGGMIELPIPSFPTGVMRGRFSEDDGHLYLCGMFAWAGNATQPGGLYRLRATGRPMHLPTGLSATEDGVRLTFTDQLDSRSVTKDKFQIKTWSLKRTANYGSKHFDERPLAIDSVELLKDGKTVVIRSSKLQPTWCMEIQYNLRAIHGEDVSGTIDNTIHALKEKP